MTADETPERAADELAAVSQEPGCGDEQREIDWMRTPELGPIVYRGNPDALEEIRAAVRHAYVSSPVPDVCAECGWHRYDPSQPAREIPADEREQILRELVTDAEHHGLYEATAEPVGVERLPTAREIPADELAEAELCGICALPIPPDGWVLDERDQHVHEACLLAAALDELRRECDAARAEVERLRDLRRQLWQAFGRPDGVGLDVELVDAVADAVQSGRAARAEVERLRARDEKAAAVVQAWWGRRGAFEQGAELWAALDVLARAHEET